MLVLSRKKNESVIIGDVIEVAVVQIRDDKVRLGVVAPREMPVSRKEVWDVIAKEAPPTSLPVEKLVGRGQVPEGPMLVLSRKQNESIVINGDITVVVVEIRRDKVRLGIESPIEVMPHRREIYEAIRRMNAEERTPD